MNDNQNDWKLVTEYGLREYANGLKAGHRVRLRSELIIRDHRDQPNGKSHPAGEIWTVLSGVVDEPDVVWLLEAVGDRHTWTLDDFFESFELIDTDHDNAIPKG